MKVQSPAVGFVAEALQRAPFRRSRASRGSTHHAQSDAGELRGGGRTAGKVVRRHPGTVVHADSGHDRTAHGADPCVQVRSFPRHEEESVVIRIGRKVAGNRGAVGRDAQAVAAGVGHRPPDEVGLEEIRNDSHGGWLHDPEREFPAERASEGK
jgi:hypothetical protein